MVFNQFIADMNGLDLFKGKRLLCLMVTFFHIFALGNNIFPIFDLIFFQISLLNTVSKSFVHVNFF